MATRQSSRFLSRRQWFTATGLGGLAAVSVPPTRAAATLGYWLQRMVDRVRAEREFLVETGHADGLNTSFVVGLSVMNAVVGHVSAPVYGDLVTLHGEPKSADPEVILEREAGICGGAQAVFAALAAQVGVICRKVYLWYPEQFPEYTGPGTPGHATVEVYYYGTWHWFDPTYGFFFRVPDGRADDVPGVLDVVTWTAAERAAAWHGWDTLLWNQIEARAGHAPDEFLDYVHLRIESPVGTVLYAR